MVMKKIIVLLLLMSTSTMWAQIQTSSVKVASKAESTQPKAPYDSTKNIPPIADLDTYVGQLVFFQGVSPRENGYFGFQKKGGGRYGSGAPENSSNTRFEDLYGKYFIVDAIEKNDDMFSSVRPKRVVLRNRDDENDIVTYRPHYKGENPWVTVSYYNYVRSQIGKKFYLLEKSLKGSTYEYGYCLNSNDINTGEPITFGYLDLWELVDISTNEDDLTLIAIFKNTKGNMSFCSIFDFGKTAKDSYKLLPQQEYNRLAKKYGSYYTKLMLKHDYEVGMPKELFRLLWGAPDSINSSAYSEQWIYGGYDADYFYFSNGKLTNWN